MDIFRNRGHSSSDESAISRHRHDNLGGVGACLPPRFSEMHSGSIYDHDHCKIQFDRIYIKQFFPDEGGGEGHPYEISL